MLIETNLLRRHWQSVVVIAIALLSIAFQLGASQPSDDLYIWLRYSRNLWKGHGLVYNPGGERVEGFSNPLFVILNAPLFAFSDEPSHLVQIENLALGVLLLVFLWRLSRLVLSGTLVPLACILLYSSCYYAHVQIRGGMETVLYTLLLVSGSYFYLSGWKGNTAHRPLVAGLLFGLASITRPEGIMFFCAVLLHAAWRVVRRRLSLFYLSYLSAGLVLPFGWFVFRLLYFGYPLPNTFYAKVPTSRLRAASSGKSYLENFLARVSYVPVIGVFAVKRDLTKSISFIASMVGAGIVYILIVGSDYFPNYRFIYPILPFLAILVISAVLRVQQMLCSWRSQIGLFLSIVVAAVVLVGFAWPTVANLEDVSARLKVVREEWQHPRAYLTYHNRFTVIGQLFRERLEAGQTLALVSAGAIPYLSDLPTIDMLGLNDTYLAHRGDTLPGGHSKGDASYILARAPRYILLNPYITETPNREVLFDSRFYAVIRDLWASPEFHRDYEPRDLYFSGGVVTVWERVQK